MKDIINQIIEVDKISCETQEKKQSELSEIRQAYEEAINIYKKEKLYDAKQSAMSIAEKMESVLNKEKEKQEAAINKIYEEIDKSYKNTEKVLIEKLLNELFIMEG